MNVSFDKDCRKDGFENCYFEEIIWYLKLASKYLRKIARSAFPLSDTEDDLWRMIIGIQTGPCAVNKVSCFQKRHHFPCLEMLTLSDGYYRRLMLMGKRSAFMEVKIELVANGVEHQGTTESTVFPSTSKRMNRTSQNIGDGAPSKKFEALARCTARSVKNDMPTKTCRSRYIDNQFTTVLVVLYENGRHRIERTNALSSKIAFLSCSLLWEKTSFNILDGLSEPVCGRTHQTISVIWPSPANIANGCWQTGEHIKRMANISIEAKSMVVCKRLTVSLYQSVKKIVDENITT